MPYNNVGPDRGFLCFRRRPECFEMPDRTIRANLPDFDLPDNTIKSSKYSVFTFLPLNLKKQFSKLANVYFLIIGFLQMLPPITNSGGLPVIYIPLLFVVFISLVKDAFEEYQRYQSDKVENNRVAEVIGRGPSAWSTIRVGELIRIRSGESFPADVLLLCTSDPKQTCYVQTKNLDGETNLKTKTAQHDLAKLCLQKPLTEVAFEVNYERPSPNIYAFNGSVELGGRTVILEAANLCLRGCGLRITEWAVGLVLYNGYDTRVMLNSNKSRTKKSRLQFRMGKLVVFVFLIQMTLTFALGLVRAVYSEIFSLPYTELGRPPFWLAVFQIFGAWTLLCSNFVPISLIVTLEMVKFAQGQLLSGRVLPNYGEIRVQSSSLNEELGQVEHIFSDKTGTLTCNYMSFRKLTLGRRTFQKRTLSEAELRRLPQVTNVDFGDAEFLQLVRARDEAALDFLRVLALCHSIIIQEIEGVIEYNASSPDELAFINFAKFCGVEYLGTDSENRLQLMTLGQREHFVLHFTFPFDNYRKRMSVLVTDERGRHWLIAKGADSIMLEITDQQDPGLVGYRKELEAHSRQGLRTLVLARREVPDAEFRLFEKAYTRALASRELAPVQQPAKPQIKKPSVLLDLKAISMEEGLYKVISHLIDDEGEGDSGGAGSRYAMFEEELGHLSRDQRIEALQNGLQKGLRVAGVTAIEDRLQPNVKESIEALRDANIKFWMLTGDKLETAVSIGISCGVIGDDMEQVIVQDELPDLPDSPRERCLVIEGRALIDIMQTQKERFLETCRKCRSVICCRVSPKQKQEVVFAVRKCGHTVLAIGDGANDVNMINAAHVGVGVKGVEGTQAARCADYSISEFQLLTRLVLADGRECYRRNANLIAYTFYKNILLVLPQLWLGINGGLTALSLYDPIIYQLFNVIFTGLPIVVYAVLDEQHDSSELMASPELYQSGLRWDYSSADFLGWWLAKAVVESLTTYLLVMYCFDSSKDGLVAFLNLQGAAIMGVVVLLANLQVVLLACEYSIGLVLSCLGSALLYYVMSALLSQAEGSFSENTMGVQYVDFEYYLVIASCLSITLLLHGLARLRAQVRPPRAKDQEVELPLINYQY